MAANVLNSPEAVTMGVYVVRAFIQGNATTLRDTLLSELLGRELMIFQTTI